MFASSWQIRNRCSAFFPQTLSVIYQTSWRHNPSGFSINCHNQSNLRILYFTVAITLMYFEFYTPEVRKGNTQRETHFVSGNEGTVLKLSALHLIANPGNK
jgi:hypothetical protein